MRTLDEIRVRRAEVDNALRDIKKKAKPLEDELKELKVEETKVKEFLREEEKKKREREGA